MLEVYQQQNYVLFYQQNLSLLQSSHIYQHPHSISNSSTSLTMALYSLSPFFYTPLSKMLMICNYGTILFHFELALLKSFSSHIPLFSLQELSSFLIVSDIHSLSNKFTPDSTHTFTPIMMIHLPILSLEHIMI